MISGNGTQASPYVVTTWNELVEVIAVGNYIELGTDIQAPDTSVSINMDKVYSFDGKGYTIRGLKIYNGAAFEWTENCTGITIVNISNIVFEDVTCTDSGVIKALRPNLSSSYKTRLENLTVNGRFSGDYIFSLGCTHTGYAWDTAEVVGCSGCVYMESAGKIVDHTTNDNQTYIWMLNCNWVAIYDMDVVIPQNYYPFDAYSIVGCRFDLYFNTSGNPVYFKMLNNCCVTGVGAGLYDAGYTDSRSVVEDSIPNRAGAMVSSDLKFITTSQIKNRTYLTSIGFNSDWLVDTSVKNGYPYLSVFPTLMGDGAFAFAKQLKKIVIPSSVKYIGKEAFRNTQLTSVTIASDCTYYPTSFPEGCVINFY